MRGMRHTKRRDEIERLLADGKRRGLTYAEIAAAAGITRSTLAGWAWRLRREAHEREREGASAGEGFVELVAGARTESTRVEITLASGRRITVASDIDRQQLVHLIAAVESC